MLLQKALPFGLFSSSYILQKLKAHQLIAAQLQNFQLERLMLFAFSAFGSLNQVNHGFFPGNIKLHKLLLHKPNNSNALGGL